MHWYEDLFLCRFAFIRHGTSTRAGILRGHLSLIRNLSMIVVQMVVFPRDWIIAHTFGLILLLQNFLFFAVSVIVRICVVFCHVVIGFCLTQYKLVKIIFKS